MSRTCASCDAESGNGLRDGIGSWAGSPTGGGWRPIAAMYDGYFTLPIQVHEKGEESGCFFEVDIWS